MKPRPKPAQNGCDPGVPKGDPVSFEVPKHPAGPVLTTATSENDDPVEATTGTPGGQAMTTDCGVRQPCVLE